MDDSRRALLRVRLKSAQNGADTTFDAWIDTGFTGDLVLPRLQVETLALPVGAVIDATLGDGSTAKLTTYTCLIEWFGEWKPIEVIANEGRFALLGVGLLLGHDLHIDYRAKTLTIV